MKTIVLAFLLIITLSASAQENWIDESHIKLKNETISCKKHLQSIKQKLLKKENLDEPLGDFFSYQTKRDSLMSLDRIKDLNRNFQTKVFSSIHEENEIGFYYTEKKESKEMPSVYIFQIRESVYTNEKDAKKAHTFLLDFHDLKKYNPKVPVSVDWVQKDNLIYSLYALSADRESNIYQELLNLIKETIEE